MVMTPKEIDRIGDEILALLDQAIAATKDNDFERALELTMQVHLLADSLPRKPNTDALDDLTVLPDGT
jgi:hypothetical protein